MRDHSIELDKRRTEEEERRRTDEIRAGVSGMAEERVLEEKFTYGLALVDFLPVLLFSITGLILAERLADPLFTLGAVLVALAGLGKALWKFLKAAGRDYRWMNWQMHYTMPLGFALMILVTVLDSFRGRILWGLIFAKMPGISLLLLGISCAMMILMGIMAAKMAQR